MAEGLRPHHHQEFEYHTIQYLIRKDTLLLRRYSICV